MADTDNPDTKYMTFLRETRRRVKMPASDHDRVIVADARRKLEKRGEELDRIQEAVKAALKRRRTVLTTEDDFLRELFDANMVEKSVPCLVFVDARNGGTIKLIRKDNGELFADPRPLTKEEREVFASTKSSPSMFGDEAMNEELAKKLKLTEYIADDAPIDPQVRVRAALEQSEIPDDLKEILLTLDQDESDEPSALSEAKAKNSEKKKPGRPKKDAAPPAPLTPAAPAEDAEPGPAKAEKDEEPPRMPKPPRAAQPDEAEGTDESEPTGDDDASEGEAPGEDDAAAEQADAKIDDDVAEAEDELPADVTDGADESDASEPADAVEGEAPDGDDLPAHLFVEDEPADEPGDDLPDFGPSAMSPADESAPEAPANDTTETEPDAAPPAPEAAADAPAAEHPVEPAEPEAKAEEPALVLPAKPKAKATKAKKAEEPAAAPTPSAPAEPVIPAHALSEANHFGFAQKTGALFVKCIADAVGVTPIFAPHAVAIASSPKVNDGKALHFSPKWVAALVPVLDHLAAQKTVRRRETNGVVVYWHEKHDAKIDDVIAGYMKDQGLAYIASLQKK